MQPRFIASFGFALAIAGFAASSARADGECPAAPFDPGLLAPAGDGFCRVDVWGNPDGETHDVRGWCTNGEANFQISTSIRNFDASVEVVSNRQWGDQKCDWGYLDSEIFCGVSEDDPNPVSEDSWSEQIVVAPEGTRWYQGPMFRCPSDRPVVVHIRSTFEAHGSLEMD